MIKKWIKDHQIQAFALLLILLCLLLVFYKVIFLDYRLANIIPQVKYDVQIAMEMEGFGDPISIDTFIPSSDDRQVITEEIHNYGSFSFELKDTENGRIANWSSESVEGKQYITYSFTALVKHIRFELADDLVIPEDLPPHLLPYLKSTPTIQLDDESILQKYEEIVTPGMGLKQTLEAIYEYTASLKPMPFKGLTDASTAIKLGEASCNGKSRAFIALARLAGIPSRLVGGLILQNGSKKTSHQWVEVYINGYWIPFDALNRHFAEIPESYLSLYYGDYFLFKHSPNINFKYLFTIKKRLTTSEDFIAEIKETPFNTYAVWEAFQKIGIPLSLLRIIIMIPLGVSMIVIFRNVIGFQTFGTFLPALIATASRGTGFFWGMIGFMIIIMLVSLLHLLLDKWGMLHTPKMSIMLIMVIISMFGLTVIGVKTGLFQLSQVSLFPIAILAITAERFSLITVEEGWPRALKVSLMTAIVIGFAYLAMNSLAMQTLFLAFPELLLILVAFNLWLGKWIGIRVTEYKRFRWLVEDEKKSV